VSANIEYALISRVLESQDFHTLEKMQITADFFTVPEVRAIYDWLRLVYHNPNTAGMVPSVEMVKQYFHSFNPAYAPDEVAVLATALRDSKLRMELLALSAQLQLEADKDPHTALASLKLKAQTLASMDGIGADLSMSGAYNALMERYDTVASAKGVVGIPYPWEALNAETQGMQGGQFIVFYARPKSMKTWVAIYCAVHAYMHSRRRVLFYTKEMPQMQIAGRVASAICGVDYRAFKNGELQPELLAFVKAALQGLLLDEQSAGKHGHQPCFIITADRGHGGGGVSGLQAKIREVKPDIVFVDGMYLMKDDRTNQRTVDWKQIAHISQDLKLTSQEFDIPIVGITQASRKSDTTRTDSMEDISYADALAQDTDAVFRIKKVTKKDAEGHKKTELYIYAPGLREGILDGIVINAVPATDFSFNRIIVDEEEADEPAYEKKPKAPSATFRSSPGNYVPGKDPKTFLPK
jgi:replicative DNA helicase